MFRALLLAAGLSFGLTAAAAQNAGPYLAGRAAQIDDDFAASARYLAEAYRRDPSNLPVMEALIGAYVSLGRFDRAEAVASDLVAAHGTSQVAALALVVQEAASGNWADLMDDLDNGISVGPLFDGLARGWALVAEDRVEEALTAFDSLSDDGTGNVAAYGIYYRALAEASLGRFEDAAATFEGAGDLSLTRRGLRARVQILSQLGRNEAALALLDAQTGDALDATIDTTRAALEAGETLAFTIAPTPRAGLAEVSVDIANAVVGSTAPSYALLYSRAAERLRPDLVEATLLSAVLLEDMGQIDLAIDAYASIPADAPAYPTAELARAEALRAAGRTEEALTAMRALAEAYPDLPLAHVTLGDAFRDADRFAEARDAYDAAIALFDEERSGQWIVYFARAITSERLGDWDRAEADFSRALELNPDQPQVLNYLGYSLLERGERLQEALDLIEQAAAQAPNSGYIIDSLGWGLYRLGRYREAVEPMERAVELMPVDPVLNDHLGDVLWAVGRKLEARFQWQRALSFVDNDQSGEVEPDRIRRKLEVGLDRVLEEEGAPPLKVADGG